MPNLSRSPVLIAAVLMLLAICGGTASAATSTRTTAAPVTGEFAGDAGHLAGIGLSTNGRQVIAYLCNGTSGHVSLAQWFHGPVTRDRIDITSADGAHLVATASAQAITGTVTLKDGRSAHFTALLIPHPGGNYGLFRSAETFKGVHYLGGWIFVPRGLLVAPAETLSLVTPAGTLGWFARAGTPSCGNTCLPRAGGAGIINERTGALIVGLPIKTGSVTVPGLGKFQLTACRQAQC